ncbi:MAG TPA: HD domain-containing protein [Flavobacterium sp.]|nr:HD domain-containing protein [Flavobacterium sp.]
MMQFQKAKNYISSRLRKELPKHLYYHSVSHVKDVYDSARRIAVSEGIKGEDLKLLLIAAMYHDCGFIIQAKDHEQISCDIAKENLPQFDFTEAQIEKICGMILATKLPQEPKNLLEEIICDADLDYLGRDDFFTIGNKLFLELQVYGIISNQKEWDTLQIRFLEQHHYFTPTAIDSRKPQKEKYLSILKQKNDLP